MTNLAQYVPLGAVIRLEAPLDPDVSPGKIVTCALTVADALAGICQPLAVTLLLGLRIPGVPVLEYEPEPERPIWQVVEARLPASVIIRKPNPSTVRSELPVLSGYTLRAWAASALEQAPPDPGLEVVPASLRVSYVRARVTELPAGTDTYVVSDGGDLIELPVEHRADGPWVLAPAHDLLMQPPVSWSVSYDGSLFAELWVSWSPWLDVDQPEGAGVRAAVEYMRGVGWQLRAPVYDLKLEP